MIEQVFNTVRFVAFYAADGVGVEGLTDVLVDVYGPDGNKDVNGDAASEIGGGLYSYDAGVVQEGEYLAIFKTADATVDQKHLPALWSIGRAGIESLDGAISDVAPDVLGGISIPDPSTIAAAVWADIMANYSDPGTFGAAQTDILAGAQAVSNITDPLENDVPGVYAPGSAGYVLGRIGTAEIVTPGPVSVDGGTLTLVRGDDYSSEESRELSFSSSDWPDLTGAVITMTVRRRAEAFGSGSDGVLFTLDDTPGERSAGGDPQSVTFEPTNAMTDDLLPGDSTGKFDIQATLSPSGRVVTLSTGLVTVTEDQTRLPGTLPPTWTLYGVFQTFNGVPLAGWTVYLWDENGPTGDSAVADGNGDFQFDNLTAGLTYGASDINNPNNPPPTLYADGDTAADNRAVTVGGGPA